MWSGRPLRALRNKYIEDWEENRQEEIKKLSAMGVVALEWELDRLHKEGMLTEEIEEAAALRYGIVSLSVVREDGGGDDADAVCTGRLE